MARAAGEKELSPQYNLSDNEREFLRVACIEYTYNQIAEQMKLSPKTIDGCRDLLFEKLKVRSRVSLAMFAVKNGLVEM